MIRKTWQSLTRPHPSITDIEERRQSQLLAALALALMLTTSLATLAIFQREGEFSGSSLGASIGIVVTLVNYLLNRAGKYRASAWLFVGFNFLLVFSMPIITGDPVWLWFSNMTIIFGAMLLPRWSPWIFLLGFAAHFAELQFYPLSDTYSNFPTMVVYSIISPLILVFMNTGPISSASDAPSCRRPTSPSRILKRNWSGVSSSAPATCKSPPRSRGRLPPSLTPTSCSRRSWRKPARRLTCTLSPSSYTSPKPNASSS